MRPLTATSTSETKRRAPNFTSLSAKPKVSLKMSVNSRASFGATVTRRLVGDVFTLRSKKKISTVAAWVEDGLWIHTVVRHWEHTCWPPTLTHEPWPRPTESKKLSWAGMTANRGPAHSSANAVAKNLLMSPSSSTSS
jgi:hypothetical protein